MKRLETTKVNIGGEILPLRFSILSFITFKEKFDKEISDVKTIEDQIQYFYCAYLAGCKYDDVESTYSYKDWFDLIDDFPQSLKDLSEAMVAATESKKK